MERQLWACQCSPRVLRRQPRKDYREARNTKRERRPLQQEKKIIVKPNAPSRLQERDAAIPSERAPGNPSSSAFEISDASNTQPQRTFACPYHKMLQTESRPSAWLGSSCTLGFKSCRELKHHLHKNHPWPEDKWSHRFSTTFKDPQELANDLVSENTCSPALKAKNGPRQTGFLTEIPRTMSEEEEWREIWRTVFPEEIFREIPSPYIDDLTPRPNPNISDEFLAGVGGAMDTNELSLLPGDADFAFGDINDIVWPIPYSTPVAWYRTDARCLLGITQDQRWDSYWKGKPSDSSADFCESGYGSYVYEMSEAQRGETRPPLLESAEPACSPSREHDSDPQSGPSKQQNSGSNTSACVTEPSVKADPTTSLDLSMPVLEPELLYAYDDENRANSIGPEILPQSKPVGTASSRSGSMDPPQSNASYTQSSQALCDLKTRINSNTSSEQGSFEASDRTTQFDLVGPLLASNTRSLIDLIIMDSKRLLGVGSSSTTSLSEDFSFGEESESNSSIATGTGWSLSSSSHPGRSHTSGGSSRATGCTRGTRSQNSKACGNERVSDSARKRQRPEEESSDERDGDGSRKRRRKQGNNGGNDGGDKRRLACPYQKRYPMTPPTSSSCLYPGFENVSRLKEHLLRRHTATKPQCTRCFQTFATSRDLTEHLITPEGDSRCPGHGEQEALLLTPVQIEELKPKSARVSEEEKWRTVYSIIFKGDDEALANIPSPYCEETPSPTLEAAHQERLIQAVVQVVVDRITSAMPLIEEHFRSQLPDIIRSCQRELAVGLASTAGSTADQPRDSGAKSPCLDHANPSNLQHQRNTFEPPQDFAAIFTPAPDVDPNSLPAPFQTPTIRNSIIPQHSTPTPHPSQASDNYRLDHFLGANPLQNMSAPAQQTLQSPGVDAFLDCDLDSGIGTQAWNQIIDEAAFEEHPCLFSKKAGQQQTSTDNASIAKFLGYENGHPQDSTHQSLEGLLISLSSVDASNGHGHNVYHGLIGRDNFSHAPMAENPVPLFGQCTDREPSNYESQGQSEKGESNIFGRTGLNCGYNSLDIPSPD